MIEKEIGSAGRELVWTSVSRTSTCYTGKGHDLLGKAVTFFPVGWCIHGIPRVSLPTFDHLE